MERKTNSSSHQKRVDSGPVLKRNHTTNYATRQCKDGRDGGDNCERGLESVRYERVRIDDEVREDPERNACKFSESACEKPSYSSLKGPVFTMTPATNPAMNGPTSGMAAPRMRLMRNPAPIARRRSAVLS